MVKINTADLQPGMVLAHNLTSPQGRLLLAAGTQLEPRHLTICKIWGVIEADVVGVQPDEVECRAQECLDPQRLERAKALVARRFAHSGVQGDLLRELARQAVLHLAGSDGPLPEPAPSSERFATERSQFPVPSLDAVIMGESGLASLPDIFHRIVEAIQSPRSSAAFVAEVISKDVGLSAKLLKIVNSPLYGMTQKVDTLSRAVALVGSNQLTNLALGVSVISLFRDVPPQLMDMRSFWKHSVCCGVWARLLAGQLRVQHEERYFVGGLLHDVGRLLLLKKAPELYCGILEAAAAEELPVHELETQLLGYDHAQVGGRLLEQWRFPRELLLAAQGHHAPLENELEDSLEAALVHLADIVAHALQDEVGGPLDRVPALSEAAWQRLGLSKNVIAPLLPQARHQLGEIMSIFFDGQG